jgi:hypothetical protein
MGDVRDVGKGKGPMGEAGVRLPPKPKYGEACNRCGLCCALELCVIGELAHPGASAPCPSLKMLADGTGTYCEFVAAEQHFGLEPKVSRALGIGNGCGMRDDYQTIHTCRIDEGAQ